MSEAMQCLEIQMKVIEDLQETVSKAIQTNATVANIKTEMNTHISWKQQRIRLSGDSSVTSNKKTIKKVAIEDDNIDRSEDDDITPEEKTIVLLTRQGGPRKQFSALSKHQHSFNKPKDTECYSYRDNGYCPRGENCRFEHIEKANSAVYSHGAGGLPNRQNANGEYGEKTARFCAFCGGASHAGECAVPLQGGGGGGGHHQQGGDAKRQRFNGKY
jgi:hypothetical protein